MSRRLRQLVAATGAAALLLTVAALIGGCMAMPGHAPASSVRPMREYSTTPDGDPTAAEAGPARPGERPTPALMPTPEAEPAPTGTTAPMPTTATPRSPVASADKDRLRRERFAEAYRLMVKGEYAQAEARLAALVQQAEDAGANEGLDEMLFWLAQSREQQGHAAEAAQTYRAMLRRFPASGFATDARERADALSPPPANP